MDDPLLHAKLIQIHQKLQGVHTFVQDWDAKKVAEIAQQRLQELQALEEQYQKVCADMAQLNKEQSLFLSQEKSRWETERTATQYIFDRQYERLWKFLHWLLGAVVFFVVGTIVQLIHTFLK